MLSNLIIKQKSILCASNIIAYDTRDSPTIDSGVG